MMSQEVIDVLTSNIDTLWVIDCAILVFIMQAGFMCMETGLSRHKNSINVALKNAIYERSLDHKYNPFDLQFQRIFCLSLKYEKLDKFFQLFFQPYNYF